MALRLASQNTKRVAIGEEDYIEVLEDISRREFGRLLKVLPRDTDNLTPESAEGFTLALFELFVKGWSVCDSEGNPVPATEENYFLLSREAAGLIDAAVIEHFNSLTPSAAEQSKSEDDSGTQRTELQRQDISGE